VIVDPKDDPMMLQLINDVYMDGLAVFNYKDEPDRWRGVSGKIARRIKHLTDGEEPFLYPVSTSRYKQMGFITKPKNVTCEKQPFGDKFKFVFHRKLF